MHSISCGEEDQRYLRLLLEATDCMCSSDESTFLLPDADGAIVSIVYYKGSPINVKTGFFQLCENKWWEVSGTDISEGTFSDRRKLHPDTPNVPSIPDSPLFLEPEDCEGWMPIFYREYTTIDDSETPCS